MGRKSLSGGVAAKGKDRIELTFVYEGVRYRPTISRTPSEANLRRARAQLADIKARIRAETFRFEEEFPDYRLPTRLPRAFQKSVVAPAIPTETMPAPPCRVERTCKQVFDAFLRHCEVRVAGSDMAYSTLNSYRKILARNWRPPLDAREFKSVTYGELVEIAGEQGWRTKKSTTTASALYAVLSNSATKTIATSQIRRKAWILSRLRRLIARASIRSRSTKPRKSSWALMGSSAKLRATLMNSVFSRACVNQKRSR